MPLDYHLTFWKAEVVDFVVLQQDAFDKIDRNSSLERQKYMLDKVLEVLDMEFSFESFEEVNPYFKKLINEMKQMNYSVFESDNFKQHEKEFYNIIEERKVA